MAILVSAHRLTKAFGARPLFEGLTFSIESGERVGLIGPNGAGKSTLLRILASQSAPDSGTLSLSRGLRVGFLEQDPRFGSADTLLSALLEGASQAGRDPQDPDCQQDAGELLSRFELDRFGAESPVARLSGGWKKRVALARELMKKPDLLLLDEPTNHLDVEGILWLEELLAGARFATLTITHDRAFLQKAAQRIIELDPRHPGGLLNVKGNYATYLEVREQLISAQEQREIVLRNTLRRETEWLRRGAQARSTKQQARIERAGRLQETVEDLSRRNQVRTAGIEFQGTERSPKKLLEAKSLSKGFGGRSLFRDLNLLLTPGTRLGLLGPNGSGKSTLIRVLLGAEPPDSGSVFRSENLSVAYFDQVRETLDPELTLVRTLCPSGEFVDYRGERVHIRSYLDRFLFSQAQMDMPVGKLSGGEQSRVLIARLMLRPANLLVLDEPTNDLDLPTLSILQDCLTEFGGAILLVTHDRFFLDQVATRILAFSPRTEPANPVFFSTLSQWEEWHGAELKAERKARKGAEPASAKEASPAARKRKLSFKEQRELDTMEETIHEAESRLKAASEAASAPENISNPEALSRLTTEMAELEARIAFLYNRWSELETPQ